LPHNAVHIHTIFLTKKLGTYPVHRG
jgi:hypothetical protein